MSIIQLDSRMSDGPWRQQQLRVSRRRAFLWTAALRGPVRSSPRGRARSPPAPLPLRAEPSALHGRPRGGPAGGRRVAGRGRARTWRPAVLAEGVSRRTGGSPAPPPAPPEDSRRRVRRVFVSEGKQQHLLPSKAPRRESRFDLLQHFCHSCKQRRCLQGSFQPSEKGV